MPKCRCISNLVEVLQKQSCCELGHALYACWELRSFTVLQKAQVPAPELFIRQYVDTLCDNRCVRQGRGIRYWRGAATLPFAFP